MMAYNTYSRRVSAYRWMVLFVTAGSCLVAGFTAGDWHRTVLDEPYMYPPAYTAAQPAADPMPYYRAHVKG